MPKRTESHELDEAAERVLKGQLQRDLVVRRQHPDYGIDFVIERFEPDSMVSTTRPSGRQFAIQLKGTRSPTITNNELRYRLKTDHMEYYVDKALMPVFLVVVLVPQREGYWLFLQKYAEEQLPPGWRGQQTITVRLPLANRLDDTSAFTDAVSTADIWVGIRQVGDNLRAERERLEKMDPRFFVEIRATEKARHHVLHAKEPVTVTMTGPAKRMKRLLDRGGSVKFGPNELSVTGSPLFEDRLAQGAKIEWGLKGQTNLRYTAQDNDGRCLGQIDSVSCKITGGMKQVEIRGELPDSPFGLRMTVRTVRGRQRLPSCKFKFSPNKWRGQRLLQLAYFDQLYSVFKPVATGAHLRTDVIDKGNATLLGLATVKDTAASARIADYLEIVGRAREVARQLELNPQFPGELTEAQVVQINELHELVTAIPQPYPDATLTAKMFPDGIERLIEASRANPGGTWMITGPREFKFLDDATVELQTEQTITHCDLESDPDELRRAAAAAGPNDGIPVKWKSNSDSVVTIRRAPKD